MKTFPEKVKIFFDLINPATLKLYPKDYFSDSSPIFIGGCGRSGTTLLRILISKHPEVFSGPEFNIHINQILRLKQDYPYLPQRAYMLRDKKHIQTIARKYNLEVDEVKEVIDESIHFPEFVDRLFSYLVRKNNKSLWLEKTPKNCNIIDYLFKYFPSSKFIHIIRDGRDVACSLRNHPNSYVDDDGNLQPLYIDNPISKCIGRWINDVGVARKYKDDERYYELKYEDLLQNSYQEMRQVFSFIGLNFDDSVDFDQKAENNKSDIYFSPSKNASKQIDKKRMGRWKSDLSKEEAFLIQERAGELLQELEYVKDSSWLNYYKK